MLLTIQLTLLAFSPNLFFALLIASFEISSTVIFWKPSSNKKSTNKLSPPPTSMIEHVLGKLNDLINSI